MSRRPACPVEERLIALVDQLQDTAKWTTVEYTAVPRNRFATARLARPGLALAFTLRGEGLTLAVAAGDTRRQIDGVDAVAGAVAKLIAGLS